MSNTTAPSSLDWPWRYGFAAAAGAVAVVLRVALDPLLGELATFGILVLAVLVTARYVGFGPAAATTLLGAVATHYLIVVPRYSLFAASPAHYLNMLIYIGVGLGVAVLAGEMHRALHAAKLAAAKAMRQHDELQITLASIGDAVAVTDEHARIVSLNPVAETLTGWPAAEAIGRPLVEVFVMLDETTRDRRESLFDRTAREGVVRQANHTVLVARHGAERPIDMSSSPIRNAAGKLAGMVLVFHDVSERRAAESALRKSERELQQLADSMPQIVFASNAQGVPEYYNRRWYEFTGQPEGMVGPGMWSPLIHPDHMPSVREAWRQALASQTLFEAEAPLRDKDGNDRWHLIRTAPAFDEAGRVTRWYGSATDIHERKLAERRMQMKARVLDSMAEGVSLADEKGVIIYTNPAEDRMFGYEPGELIGRHVSVQNDYPPEENQRRVAMVIDELNNGGMWNGEWANRRKDGSSFTTQCRITAFEVHGQRYFVCVQEDVTERRAAADELRRSEERLRLALDAGRMGTWEWTVRSNRVNWSTNLEMIHGLEPGAFPGTFEAYQVDIHPADREMVFGSINRALEGSHEHHVEYRIIWPDGTLHWLESRGKLFMDDEGRPSRMVGVCTEITSRKRVEQDFKFLADASAALAGLVDLESTLQKVAGLAVPTFADWCTIEMLDEQGSLKRVAVAHVDPAKVQLAHEIHRRWPPSPTAPSGAWAILRHGRGELTSDVTDDVLRAAIADPEMLTMLRELGLRSYIGVPLEVRGKVLGVVTFISAESGRRYEGRDLSLAEDLAHRAAVAIENSRLYHEVREADRRKEDFLSMLAHELRNPLAPVRNGLEILKLVGREGAKGSPGAFDAGTTASVVDMMERQVQHLVRLVDDLLDVSRIMRNKIELRRERIELATIVHRAVETSQPSVDSGHHTLTVSLPAEPLYIHGDLVRLVQALGNLINNAARYSDPGGRIEVIGERVGDRAVIRVRDSGIGIAPEMLSKIWEMFVQANSQANHSHGGMGIGLTLVRSLVEMHGGRVEARSDGIGHGSEFTITLPLIGAVPNGDSLPLASLPVNTASKRLLVVDDNVDAAESLAMLLRLGGHQARVAHDGPSALALAAADPPDMAFLDVGMPLMDGYELARRFREHPTLKNVSLVALTGWGQEGDRRRSREAGFDAHEVKPVEPAALQRLLANSPRPSD